MSSPTIAQKAPYPVDVEDGKKYFWCACGKSKRQPFCDGSHEGTCMTPMTWTAQATKKMFFCGCKHTRGAPLCDGAHNGL